jgi:16S rRNA (guanine527-N7)-methyltransferase
MTLETQLRRGLQAMALDVPDGVQSQLLRFLRLLEKWNKAYNLTAVREIEQMVPKHLLDSLAILPHLVGGRVLDIGTGAGLPGIPLACARPDTQFVLLDSNIKKVRFVRQAVHDLGLSNVETVHEAIENYRPSVPFDTIVARALAAIPDMLERSRHLLAPHGTFLAMKGVYPRDELMPAVGGFRVREVLPLSVPKLDAERHLIILERI